MWIKTSFTSLTSTLARGRPTHRSPPASRLCVEALEDRCLLSFVPATIYPAGASPQAVVAADFNGDSRLDLAVTNGGSNTVGVLLGNGDRTFQPVWTSATGAGPESLLAADLSGDGKTDLVTVNSNYDHGAGDLSVLLGNGDGTFQSRRSVGLPSQTPPGYSGPPLWQGTTAAALGDLNADGTLDLVARGLTSYYVFSYYDPDTGYPYYDYYTDAYVNVLLGNGDATFGPGTTYHVSHQTAGSISLGDFNSDGRMDVASYEGVMLGNGDGTLQTPVPSNVATYTGATIAGDVNADGSLDIVWAGYLTEVRLGYGNGSFTPPINSNIGTSPENYFSSAVLGDFDGDGFPDLAAAAPDFSYYDDYNNFYCYPGFVAVAHNDGSWTLPPPPPPSIGIGDVTVSEGNIGTRAATFTVTLSKAYGQPVTVNYSTTDASAAVGSDYQAPSGTLTIPAGQTTGAITVLVNGDRLAELNETFFVNLSSPTNATIADGQAVGTIIDDEPRISIGDVTQSEGKKNQSTLFKFTVMLSAAYDQAVTMSFGTANGTATTSDGDYVAKAGTLTFAPGETTKTITIEIKGDSKREANETFYLDLFGNSPDASGFTKNRGIGTILNDD